jgi:hypothetical protein
MSCVSGFIEATASKKSCKEIRRPEKRICLHASPLNDDCLLTNSNKLKQGCLGHRAVRDCVSSCHDYANCL